MTTRSSYSLLSLLGGTAIVALVISLPTTISAKPSKEIAQIAILRTVQINTPLLPGGSGILIGKQGNTYMVLTANHVVKRPDLPYTIRTNLGKEYPAQIQRLKSNSNSPDLAVVTFVSSDNYPTATVGDSDQAVIGSEIYVVGYPAVGGLSGAERDLEFTQGIVTSRPQNRPQDYTLRYNAVTRGGMSGGPVFDSDGRVIGIHGQGDVEGSFQTESGGSIAVKTGFNSAIPINTFLAVRSQFGQSAPKAEVDNTPSTDNPQQRLNNPQSASDYTARGAVRQEQGNKQGAVEDFNKAISLGSNNALTYVNRGVIRYNQGDMQGANEDFTQAISFAPDYALAYLNRGLARQILKDYQGMLEDSEKYVSFNPSDPVAFNNRASARAALGDRQGALADLTEAIRLEPKLITAYNNRAILRRRMGEREGAIEDLSQILRLDPNNATAYFNRGLVRRDVGNREGAIEDLQKAADLFQQKGDTSNYQTAQEKIQSIQATLK